MDVFAVAKAGTLTTGQLRIHLQQGGTVDDCDFRGLRYSLLSTAIKAGQRGTVKLLLDHEANPSLPSGNGCYPLWVAANAKKNRAEIVQLLLDKHVDPDQTSDDCDKDTPLMVAITQARDRKVISLLVDAGARLDKPNNDGQTARELAEQSGDAGIVTAIGPKDERRLSRPELINAIVTLIVFILSYVNSGVIKGVVKGVVSSLYHITKDLPLDTEVARVRFAILPHYDISFRF
jgi:ankyrin repeat protein